MALMAPELLPYEKIREDLFRPLSSGSRGYWFAILSALSVVMLGAVAWSVPLHDGMGVTGLNRPVFWGFYIVDFVFWIGISHGSISVTY